MSKRSRIKLLLSMMLASKVMLHFMEMMKLDSTQPPISGTIWASQIYTNQMSQVANSIGKEPSKLEVTLLLERS